MPRPIFFILSLLALLGTLAIVHTTLGMWIYTVFQLSGWAGYGIAAILLFCVIGFIRLQNKQAYRDTVRVRTLYRWNSYWFALLVYVFLGISMLAFVSLVVSLSLKQLQIGTLCVIVGSVALVLYGSIHTRSIRIKEVSVMLPSVPPKWRRRRMVWISDVHLGPVYREDHAHRIVEAVRACDPDMVVIGGDLFDGTRAPNLKMLCAPFGAMRAPLGVYFIPGNHEEFVESTPFFDAVRSVGAHILFNESVVIDDISFTGVDYRSTAGREDFKTILAKISPTQGHVRVLLKHEPKDLDIAQEYGFQLTISGHTHRAQLWPLGCVPWMAYRGYSYGLKRLRTMFVLVSSGAGTWGPPVRVGTHNEVVVIRFV